MTTKPKDNLEADHDRDAGTSPPERIAGYRVHPAANLFPLMSDPEIQELAADIKANGLRDFIIYITDARPDDSGKLILDGRNRLLACEIAGVKPKFDVADNGNFIDDPVAYVLSKNLQRRHLTASQRAMIALEVEKLYAEQAKVRERDETGQFIQGDKNVPVGKSAEKAAKALDVSPTYVKKAKALAETDPKAAAAVKAGKVSLSKATAAKKMKKPSVLVLLTCGRARTLLDEHLSVFENKQTARALAESPHYSKHFREGLRLCVEVGERAKRILASVKDVPKPPIVTDTPESGILPEIMSMIYPVKPPKPKGGKRAKKSEAKAVLDMWTAVETLAAGAVALPPAVEAQS